MKGPERYTRIISDLEKLLGELGAESPAELRGLTLKRIRERKEKGWVAVTTPKLPVVDEQTCTGCGTCQKVCAYDAMHVNGKARLPHPGGASGAACAPAPARQRRSRWSITPDSAAVCVSDPSGFVKADFNLQRRIV